MFQIDFAVFCDMQSAPHAFFAGFELQHVASPLTLMSLTPKREVGVLYLPLTCCDLKQRRIYSPKSTGNIQEAVAPC